ncbi:MAG: T9SS type A sorting domain-containing protein, partial [Saprospiraceae bacterium]|nr:T9SS type A sorting domain-containing protein [Saprospiraceae bacterium]
SIDIIFSGGQTPYNYSWSNGATTEDLLGLSAGIYTCTVVDDGGCTITTPSYVISNDAGGLNFDNVDLDDETCSNGLGDISLMVSGGTSPYNYIWNTGDTISIISGLSAGVYSATVTDSTGCSIYTGALNLINNSGSLSLDAVQAFDEVCGNGTGSVNITVSGNTGPLSYIWNNSSASEDLSNLTAGNYNCTVTDSVGCVVYANSTVNNDPGAMNIDNTIVIDETCGQSDGFVDLVFSGEASPTSFLWSNGATTQSITNVQGGAYTVTITDAIGCTVSGSANIQNNTGSLSLNGQVIVNEICSNGLGAIDLDVSGGATPLTYLWSDGSSVQDLSGLSSGAYTCTVTDSLGCVLVAGTYNINNSSGTLSQGTHTVTDEVCGNAAGAIDISINGGTSAVTFLWSNAQTTEDLTGLSANTYTCTVTDSSGCSIVFSETVNNDAGSLVISNAQVVDENCTDGAGAIDLTISGGTPNYSFLWSDASTNEDISSLSQGTFSVTITDQNGCETSSSYIVNNNSPNFQLSSTNVTNENCGDGSGSIDVSLLGGQPNYIYSWSNGATTEDISGLSSGVYTGTVTDINGCVVVHSSSIQNDPGTLVVAYDSVVNETCGSNNGAIYLTVANGTPAYSFLWSNGETTQNITALSGNNYSCVITDSVGCNTNYSAIVQDLGGNFQIANASVVDDACSQSVGSITTSVSGGGEPYNYNWSVATANPCCSYILNMHDLNNNGWGGNPAPFVNVFINGTLFGSFTVPPGAGNSFNSASIPVCTGDTIAVEYVEANQNDNNVYELLNSAGDTVFADGPDPFSGAIAFSDAVNCTFAGQGTNAISNLYAGNYSLTVTDTNGCSVSQNYQVNNGSGLINIALNAQTNESCGQSNGSIDVTVSGASNPVYLWSNGATTESLNGINAGSYTITATDLVNGCTYVSTYTVLNNANGITVADTTLTNETCGNGQGAIDLTVSGGVLPHSFAWSNGFGTEDILLLSAGDYTVTITDSTGCNVIQTYTVVNNANGIFASAVTSNEICGDATGSIDMTVTGGTPGYTFSWSNGSTTEDLTGITEGIYNCTITDTSNCVFVFVDTITNTPSSVVISNAIINDSDCGDDDGDVTLTVIGGQTPLNFSWSNNSNGQNLNNVYPGTYTLTITESNGCTLVDSFVVTNDGNFSVEISDTIIVNETCNNAGGSIDITPPGFGTPDFIWSNGETTEDISGLSAGSYTVSITQSFGGGCTGIETYIVLNDQGTLSLDTMISINETCSQGNGLIDITVSGGAGSYSFNWSDGSTTEDLTAIQAGTYYVTVSDSTGCSVISNATTLTNNTFGFGIAGAQVIDEQCGDGSGSIDLTIAGGTPVYSYLWGAGETIEDLTGLSSGTYDVTVSDNAGCATVQSYTVVNNTNNFSASTISVDQGCLPNSGSIDLLILGGSPGFIYLWSNGATTEDISGLSANAYYVTVTDSLGCVITDTVNVGTTLNTISNAVNITAENCTAADGTIDITPSGGTPNYSFLWSTAETTEDLSSLIAGSYSVTITDAVGCIYADTFNVGNTTGGLGLSSIPTAATCGFSNGGMALTVTGGNPSYIYFWSNGDTTSSISGVASGNYSVTVTDSNGCFISAPIFIPNIGNPVNILSIDTTDASCGLCSDGSIDLTLDTAGAPYSFIWSNSATSEDLINVLPGTYNVTITSVNGCLLDTTMTIAVNTGIMKLKGVSLKVYPNPTHGQLFVEFTENPTEEIHIEILNMLGQTLLHNFYEAYTINNRILINVEDAASGTYMIKISSKEDYISKRIVILRE